jgi:hypothetical protein
MVSVSFHCVAQPNRTISRDFPHSLDAPIFDRPLNL